MSLGGFNALVHNSRCRLLICFASSQQFEAGDTQAGLQKESRQRCRLVRTFFLPRPLHLEDREEQEDSRIRNDVRKDEEHEFIGPSIGSFLFSVPSVCYSSIPFCCIQGHPLLNTFCAFGFFKAWAVKFTKKLAASMHVDKTCKGKVVVVV